MGKILWVDLTTGQTGIERPGDELYLSYLGEYGLGTYYLYKTQKPGVDPPRPARPAAFSATFGCYEAVTIRPAKRPYNKGVARAMSALASGDLRVGQTTVLCEKGRGKMRVKDILAILAVAAATTAFTVVLLGPGRVGATSQPEGIKPSIAQPKLEVGGCVFALKTDKASYRADEMPVFEIEATNTTDAPVEKTVWISMSSSSPPSPLSRVMVLPKPLSIEKYLVSLRHGETKTGRLASKAKLPAGQSVSITMSDKDLTVLARAFSVPNTGEQVQAANQIGAVTPLMPY